MAIPKIFFTDFRTERAGLCKGRQMCICEMIIDYILTLRTLCPLWLKFRDLRALRGETPEKKTKPIDKWYTMNVTKVLTKNYETGEYPAKKQSQFVGQNRCF